MDDPPPIATAIKNRIVARAAESDSPGAVASVVLDTLLEEEADLTHCDLDDIKQLLVDAVRASRNRNGSSRGQMVG